MDRNKKSEPLQNSIYEAFSSFLNPDTTAKKKQNFHDDMEGRTIHRQDSSRVSKKSYIDYLDKFMEEKNYNIETFITSANNLEKTIKNSSVDLDSKELAVKLSGLLSAINSKVQTLTDVNYSRTENWVMKNEATNLSTPFNLSISTDLDKLETSSMYSTSTANDATFGNLDKNAVYCQYCYELTPDFPQLVKHLFQECESFKNKHFHDPKKFAMSHFQLLINEMIKCNICNINTLKGLKGKTYHESSYHHKRNLKRLKNDDNLITKQFIFCNCCKVLIPDSFMQYRLHIENKEHINNKNKHYSFSDLAGKGYQMVISKKNIVKCLECSRVEFRFDLDKVRDHINDGVHKGNSKRNSVTCPIYCEICDVSFQPFELQSHTNSIIHLNFLKTKSFAIDTEMEFQYCLFCDGQFDNLKNMAYHQEVSCSAVKQIRRDLGNYF